mmetsp:Transcript_56709/g.160859  ORF Transcript_56709/g.160859 Transcript_56709/m.160859 type:complete len:296 (+) Transcript_56709:488-1375(+)
MELATNSVDQLESDAANQCDDRQPVHPRGAAHDSGDSGASTMPRYRVVPANTQEVTCSVKHRLRGRRKQWNAIGHEGNVIRDQSTQPGQQDAHTRDGEEATRQRGQNCEHQRPEDRVGEEPCASPEDVPKHCEARQDSVNLPGPSAHAISAQNSQHDAKQHLRALPADVHCESHRGSGLQHQDQLLYDVRREFPGQGLVPRETRSETSYEDGVGDTPSARTTVQEGQPQQQHRQTKGYLIGVSIQELVDEVKVHHDRRGVLAGNAEARRALCFGLRSDGRHGGHRPYVRDLAVLR